MPGRRLVVMKSVSTSALALLVLLLIPMQIKAEEVVIIANKNVPVASLGSKDIKEIFLGKKINWENDEKIIFAVQDRTDASDTFLKTYVRKNAYDYDVFWKKQVFTGKGKAPPSFSTDQELVQFIARTPSAIGYVSSGTDTGNVKIIPVR
jgi:ABC-type phosphate transport system substrate-binding protein